MSATGKQIRELEIWQRQAGINGCMPDEITASWLAEAGLLTQRLRNCCPGQFQMQVLRHLDGSAAEGLHREVLLCCGDQACIYALTDVPPETLHTHSWLAKLGAEPLGETLQSRADVSRSEFEYACLDPRSLPAISAICTESAVWARRSDFLIGTNRLTVTEVFLGALMDCAGKDHD